MLGAVLLPGVGPTSPPVLDWSGLCCLVLVVAATGRLLRRDRPADWTHALALLATATATAGQRLAPLADYALGSPFPSRPLVTSLGVAEAAAVLAVGVPLAVCTARALRRLPDIPADTTGLVHADPVTQEGEAQVSTDPARPFAPYRTDLITVLLGTWFTVGLLLDAWAHNNVPELESFFTPWHAVFYSGFLATAAWIAWTVRAGLRAERPDPRAMPVGYAGAAVAVAGFALSAGADMTWHTWFGVEQDIDILFSPTHLGLAASMLVILTTPVRAAWADPTLPAAPGLRRLLPAVLSVALAATVLLLFLQYANAVRFDSGTVAAAFEGRGGFTADVVTGMVVTNLVLLVPLLTVACRWVLPFGAASVLYALTGGLSLAVAGFHNTEIIIGFLASGVCVDLLALWLRPTPERPVRFRTFAGLAPLLTWAVYLATAHLTSPPVAVPALDGPDAHPEGVVELYTGAPIVQACLGVLMAVLLAARRPAPVTAPAAPAPFGPG